MERDVITPQGSWRCRERAAVAGLRRCLVTSGPEQSHSEKETATERRERRNCLLGLK